MYGILHSQLKEFIKIQLSIMCTHMVDYCSPQSHIEIIRLNSVITYICTSKSSVGVEGTDWNTVSATL